MDKILFAIVILIWGIDLTFGSALLFQGGYYMMGALNIMVDVVFVPYLIDMYYRVK